MLALLSLCVWLYLFFAHGAFWRSRPQLSAATPEEFPDVDIIVPARDEAETIQAAIGSLLAQDYGGNFRVIFVYGNLSDAPPEVPGSPAKVSIIGFSFKPP